MPIQDIPTERYQSLKELILDIIRTVAPDEDLSNIKDNVRLRDQLDMDSMDFLDIVMELRKRYKIEVPKEDYIKLATIDGCIEYVNPNLPQDLTPYQDTITEKRTG